MNVRFWFMGMVAVGLAVMFTSSTVLAKKVQYRKVQEVKFDGSDVDGQVRNPDGAYLVQKRGLDFVPLYKVKKNFDDSLKDSVEYLK
ncbi:MAG: hypothetical protein NDI61_08395 [Bdellovibrionaceae bacterium]|nr:hypothetical protein [Pseudobdellovibrionaceae bacterium]